MTQTDDIKMVVTHDRQERQPITAPTKNWRFSASYDSFVVAESFVLRINISGKNPAHRKSANRYASPYDRPTTKNGLHKKQLQHHFDSSFCVGKCSCSYFFNQQLRLDKKYD